MDKTSPSVFAALDVTLRRLGGAQPGDGRVVSALRVTVATCEPRGPGFQGGSESTVKIAKADLVRKDTNLLPEYSSFVGGPVLQAGPADAPSYSPGAQAGLSAVVFRT